MVDAIKPLADTTNRPGVKSNLGGFGAIFDAKAAGYRDPLLVAATDGVGTKLLIAGATGRHNTVGIDLVAMCANDLVVQGAEPLFFLDYIATGRLEIAAMKEIITGITEGCRRAGCALIGGETAEMPGLYDAEDYDLAGFCVGAVERDRLLTGADVAAGDAVLGLASNGLHSNGFSLVRRIVKQTGLDYSDSAPFDAKRSLGEALLDPTRIYVKGALTAIAGGGVKALAHITGGGLLENIPRVLPSGLGVSLDATSWPVPEIFHWLARAGSIAVEDMARTFNCGIGMAIVCAPQAAGAVTTVFRDAGDTVFAIGAVVDANGGEPSVRIDNASGVWNA